MNDKCPICGGADMDCTWGEPPPPHRQMPTQKETAPEADRSHSAAPTPGPWEVWMHPTGDLRISPVGDHSVVIATMGRWDPKHAAELTANAGLIVSALALRKTLRELIDALDASPDDVGEWEYEAILADAVRRAKALL